MEVDAQRPAAGTHHRRTGKCHDRFEPLIDDEPVHLRPVRMLGVVHSAVSSAI